MDNQQATTITINNARKLLGKEYAGFSDVEIEELIGEVLVLANISVKQIKTELVVPIST